MNKLYIKWVRYGFLDIGAVMVAVLLLITTIALGKFEKHKRSTEMVYIEIDDMYKTNMVLS